VSDTTVVIPQFGQSQLTIACVDSLLEHHSRDFRILVVDDGSPREHVEALRQQPWRNVELIRSPQNHGTTHAWNLGLAQVNTPFAVLLNNDVKTTGDWLDRLVQPLRVGTTVIAGVAERVEPRVPITIVNNSLLHGWCLAINLQRIGRQPVFDERLRLYFSDTDLQCWALQKWGTESLSLVGSLPLQHAGHQSTRHLPQRRHFWQADSKHFERKWSIDHR